LVNVKRVMITPPVPDRAGKNKRIEQSTANDRLRLDAEPITYLDVPAAAPRGAGRPVNHAIGSR